MSMFKKNQGPEFLQIKQEKKPSRIRFLEFVTYKKLALIGLLLFLILGLLLPEQNDVDLYNTLQDQLIANLIAIAFLLYCVFIVFTIGYKKGVEVYKPLPKNYLNQKEFARINTLLGQGREVTISVAGTKEEQEDERIDTLGRH